MRLHFDLKRLEYGNRVTLPSIKNPSPPKPTHVEPIRTNVNKKPISDQDFETLESKYNEKKKQVDEIRKNFVFYSI